MNKFVMVIDDSPTVRKIIETCSETRRLRCPWVLRMALRRCAGLRSDPDASRIPDLVLLDINLAKDRWLRGCPPLQNKIYVQQHDHHHAVTTR